MNLCLFILYSFMSRLKESLRAHDKVSNCCVQESNFDFQGAKNVRSILWQVNKSRLTLLRGTQNVKDSDSCLRPQISLHIKNIENFCNKELHWIYYMVEMLLLDFNMVSFLKVLKFEWRDCVTKVLNVNMTVKQQYNSYHSSWHWTRNITNKHEKYEC